MSILCPACHQELPTDLPLIPPAYGSREALTAVEHRIFHILWQSKGEIVDFAALSVAFGTRASVTLPDTLRVHLCRLRIKLPQARIATVRHRGYVLEPAGQESPKAPNNLEGL